MKSKRLKHLQRCNNHLRVGAWNNYQVFLKTVMRSIDHPSARELLGLLEAQDFSGALMFADSISSTEYTTAAEHRLMNQLSLLLRKYPFPEGSVSADPDGKATEIFHKFERLCRRSNKKFSLFDSLRSPYEPVLSRARAWIKYVLGDLSLSDIWSLCDFGPGASIGVHGNATNAGRKLLSKSWSVSPSAFYYARVAMKEDFHIFELLTKREGSPYFALDPCLFNQRFDEKARLVDHNKVVFVPKTALVSRTIAVEPLLNGYVQKGVDLFMRKRLKRIGIDLSDQERNKELAREGSLNFRSPDPFCTIDLSSASDSISIGLCRNLLPVEWFEFLDSLRSKTFFFNGEYHRYEKFTSMGNGFCFPLETLLFASLCQVAYDEKSLRPDYSVYGDDIIVRQSVVHRVLELLSICGFRANRKKTCISGPFRESCGADWFEGEDVRPINLDYAFDSAESIFKFCNTVRSKPTCESILAQGLEFLESLIPPDCKYVRPCKGPAHTALEVPFDVFMSSPFAKWDRKVSAWCWVEVMKSACPDKGLDRFAGYSVALMRGALKGSLSSVPFAERRKTRTKLQVRYQTDTRPFISDFGEYIIHRRLLERALP